MIFNIHNITAVRYVRKSETQEAFEVYVVGVAQPFATVDVEQGRNLEKMLQTMMIKEFMG